MRLRERLSPNHGPRRDGAPIDLLLLHYTGMRDAAAALDRLCDPEAEVSAHYLIEEDGTVWRLVAEERRAWHAGQAFWAGERDINSRSIGIELVNPGHEHGYRAFPEEQLAALERLSREIIARHPIPAGRVLGHSDVAPQRKQDPGELFPWRRLAAAGVGLWPEPRPAAVPRDVEQARNELALIGYEVPQNGAPEAELRAVLAAFQRHWRQERCDGALDPETATQIAAVAASIAGERRGRPPIS